MRVPKRERQPEFIQGDCNSRALQCLQCLVTLRPEEFHSAGGRLAPEACRQVDRGYLRSFGARQQKQALRAAGERKRFGPIRNNGQRRQIAQALREQRA